MVTIIILCDILFTEQKRAMQHVGSIRPRSDFVRVLGNGAQICARAPTKVYVQTGARTQSVNGALELCPVEQL